MTDWSGRGTAFCPAAPLWALVRQRQAELGLTDDEMCDWLDWHPQVVDNRADGLMLRATAERILRAIARPRPAPALLAIRAARRTEAQARADQRSRARARVKPALSDATPAVLPEPETFGRGPRDTFGTGVAREAVAS